MRNNEIDIALEVLCRLAKPGQCLNTREIAEVCGCSQVTISQIMREALKKARIRAERLQLRDYLE
ncbi:sigma factor-like helix-turn-helix DNA-binding protein [Alteromonas sp. RKMC-009]|uniref:sigma factor-like helix-turn-helix DNA-binding protein n=1 Tax=Alteromonas sp. RKMC-009 TaxID=2267264 RepID=UPI000E69E2CE|nr:sigma factor-like helix-turn-helix DNA-binding protein [Alteromonas sp. RKMC-009]AYA63854.1 hypothetical protein DS731_07470 [Alteromonas sp. RKMC-009]